MGNFSMINLMNDNQNGEELEIEIFDVDSMTAEDRMKAGAKLKQIIDARGIKRIDLAAAASVDRKTLRTLESGVRAAQPDVLKRVIEALGLAQKGDFDLRYSDSTRSFIASVAPIFDGLPENAKEDAQNDVVVLLTGKLARANGNTAVISNFQDYRQRNDGGASETGVASHIFDEAVAHETIADDGEEKD